MSFPRRIGNQTRRHRIVPKAYRESDGTTPYRSQGILGIRRDDTVSFARRIGNQTERHRIVPKAYRESDETTPYRSQGVSGIRRDDTVSFARYTWNQTERHRGRSLRENPGGWYPFQQSITNSPSGA
ncbi:hypothetical protein [Ruminococcus sp.]|uniref:hypothetical protein n=1 Tax=Ruminococcus sp. TaxID=41978 RepID=UPI0025CE8DCA|nr:hypothetical protein [Ruminococcus sp.]